MLVRTTLFAVTAITTSAAEVDSAETSATYYVSTNPFEKITSANANVIGYLGDLDPDNALSIMDATKIQLAIAKKTHSFKQSLIIIKTGSTFCVLPVCFL